MAGIRLIKGPGADISNDTYIGCRLLFFPSPNFEEGLARENILGKEYDQWLH